MAKRQTASAEEAGTPIPVITDTLASQTEESPSSASSVIADVRRLQAELDSKRRSAIDALLQQRGEIDNTLASLGYVAGEGRRGGQRRMVRSKSPEERMCPICEVSGHDARAHKSQGKRKRKFTADELAAMHLS